MTRKLRNFMYEKSETFGNRQEDTQTDAGREFQAKLFVKNSFKKLTKRVKLRG